VVLLLALLIGLSRLAGRPGKPAAGSGEAVPATQALETRPTEDEMSSGPPDLTFYRTLGKERAAPPGGGPLVGDQNHEAPARPPGPGGALAFVVQALATRDAVAARRLRDRLSAHGFPATVTEDRSGGRPVYRVRVGRYRTRPEAEAAVRVLRQKQRLSPWILQEGE
jgi:cell division septation protein DedD